jgi:hypothetical protein
VIHNSGVAWRVVAALLLVVVGCRAPGTPAPIQAGGVGSRSFTFVDANRRGRTTVTEVYYPAITGGTDAPPAEGGPFPIVLFSHGLRGLPSDYKGLWSAWVQAGFAVVAPVYPMTSRGAAEIVPTDLVNQPADALAGDAVGFERDAPGGPAARPKPPSDATPLSPASPQSTTTWSNLPQARNLDKSKTQLGRRRRT